MQSDREARIRHRAYEIWEEEGRPTGRHDEHWERATREVEQSAEPAAPRRRATAPKRGPAEAGEPPAASGVAPRRRAQATGSGAADKTVPTAAPVPEKAARRSRRTVQPNQPS